MFFYLDPFEIFTDDTQLVLIFYDLDPPFFQEEPKRGFFYSQLSFMKSPTLQATCIMGTYLSPSFWDIRVPKWPYPYFSFDFDVFSTWFLMKSAAKVTPRIFVAFTNVFLYKRGQRVKKWWRWEIFIFHLILIVIEKYQNLTNEIPLPYSGILVNWLIDLCLMPCQQCFSHIVVGAGIRIWFYLQEKKCLL